MQQPGKTKGFLCKHCGIACSNMPSLLEHTETCHQSGDDRKFKCDECGRGYRHGGSLANHKKTHETGSFECQICTRKLSNALALKSHLRIHTSKKYTCMDCGKGFNLANQLATHQKVHCSREFLEKARNRELKQTQAGSTCDDEHVDGQDFDMISELPSDLELDVAPDSNLSNGMMSELIPSSTAEPDLAGDDEDRPFKCDMCEKTYRHNGSLINHKKSHQMGIFECSVCFKQFNNLAALTSHHRTHSKPRGHPSTVSPLSPEAYTDSMPAEVSNVLQNGASNIHFCHLCQSAFPNDDEFQNHIMLHNSSSVSFELPASTPEDHPFSYSINESPESNPYPSSSDTPPLPLLLDNAVDYDQTQGPMENGHIYVPHPIGDEPTLLDTQGEHLALPSLENLKHEPLEQASDDKKDQASSSDRRFKCHICGKSYRHAGSLINHKRSHQTGIFQCSICRKNYPHLAALRSHLRIHKGRPSMVIPSAEGDWLSSEPLTHENQHGGFPHEDDVSGILGLPQDLGDSVNMNSDEENIIDLDGSEFREQFDSSFSEDRHVDLPQGEARVERHMCADCGKTFTDIAQIKSHTCPLLNQQCHSNSFSQDCEMDFKSADYKHTVGDLGEQMVFERQKGSSDTYFHDAVDEQMMGDNENMLDCKDGNEENEEEEDGEMYQCSVCRNHYTSMQALRTHLRGHTQIHGTPSTSGPSSMSSIEAEKDEEAGQVQHGDCDLIICSTCGESFTKKQDLLAHQLLHSNTVDGQPEQYKTRNQSEHQPKEESESIICGTCGVVCTSVAQLESHNCTEQGDDRLNEYDNKADIVNESGQVCEYFSESPGNGGGRLHKCDQCGRSYRHSASLLNHKNSHKTGVFRCFVCQKRFYNLLALKNHQRTHFDVKKHSCTECGKAFKIHKQLLNHQRVHQENKAKIEELNKQIQALMEMSGSVSVSGMQAVSTGRKRRGRRRKQKNIPCSDQSSPEKNSHSGDPNDPRPFVCDQCGRSYRHAGSLVNHKNSHKTGEYYCAVCNNTYSNQLAMRNHLRIHFSVKKHCCQDCGKAFRGKKQLLNHTCKHNRKNAALKGKGRGRRRVKDLTCKNCNLLFPNAELLAGHTCSKEHDPRSTFAAVDRNCKVEASVVKEERPFECNICGRSYRHAGSLLNHKNTHKTGHFTCSFCAKPFSNPMALRNHTRIHTQKKKYVCTTCGKAFRLSSILYNHQKIHARGVIHYSCHTCGKRFQGKSGLKRHRCYRNGSSSSPLSLDGGDKCYTCDQCGRSYRHAGSLLNHKKTHSADLLHCSLCLKTFTDHLELQRHSQMARHCCPDCGKTFCEFGHLQSHMEVHSKGLPYYCSVCQQNFPNMASFEQHQQVHHSMQEQSCHQQDVQMSHSLDWDSGISQQLGLQNISKMGQEFSQMHEGMSDQEDQHESGGAFDKEKSHVCEHCGRSYRHAGSLLNHKNSHKTGSFFCSVCQKEFTNLMALKNHRRIHTEPKRYQCLECGKAFRVSTQLICHRRIHTKERPFACILCDKRFSSKSNLRHHQKLHQNAQQTFESFTMDPNAFMGLGVEPFL